MGVPARDRHRIEPALDPTDSLAVTAGRLVAAQLHRLPQPAGAAADSGHRRHRRVQHRPAPRHGAHGALRLRTGSPRLRDHQAGSLQRRPRLCLGTGGGRAHHRTLQPGRGRAAGGVRLVPHQSRAHAAHALCGPRRADHGVGRILRRVLCRVLRDGGRPLRVVAAPARHAASAAPRSAMGVAAGSVDPAGGRSRARPGIRPWRPAGVARVPGQRAGPVHAGARAHDTGAASGSRCCSERGRRRPHSGPGSGSSR